MESGEQFVMIFSTTLMPVYFAINSALGEQALF